MKKKLVRLTESDLHRIVKESINNVLKEAKKTHHKDGKLKLGGEKWIDAIEDKPDRCGNPMYKSKDPSVSKLGRKTKDGYRRFQSYDSFKKNYLDESVYYDDYDDYDDYENYDDMQFAYAQQKSSELIDDINNGLYDDKLDKLIDTDWVFSELGIDPNIAWDYVMNIVDSAHDRKCVIDKNYALKYGKDSSCPSKHSEAHPSMSSYLSGKGNLNRYNFPRYNLKNDDEWGGGDTLYKKYPSIFKKDGTFRKNSIKALNKELFGTDQYDKRPLHRKGSWNREL